MLRINALGDLHYSHHHGGAAAFYASFEPLDLGEFDITLLLGDLENPGMDGLEWAARQHTPAGKPCIVLPGNHDFYRGLDGSKYARTFVEEQTALQAEFCEQNGLTYLSQFTGKIVTVIHDVRIIAFTGWPEFARELIPADLSPKQAMSQSQRGYIDDEFGRFDRRRSYHNDFREIRVGKGNSDHRLTPRMMIDWAAEGHARLAAELQKPFDGETIVASHIGPASLIKPGDHAWLYGSRRTEDLCAQYGVSTHFHGHTHKSHDLIVGDVRVVSNSRGYPGENLAFDPRLVIEIAAPEPTLTMGM